MAFTHRNLIVKAMDGLKATRAREITKESVTEAESLVVNGVSVSKPSEPPMQAGDFYFRPSVVQHVIVSPWYRRWFFGEKTLLVNEVVTGIVISCPVCGLPILTSPAHRVWQRNPLTIDREIACPYAPAGMAGTHAFSIKEGNITIA
jgi:hypothetical protein